MFQIFVKSLTLNNKKSIVNCMKKLFIICTILLSCFQTNFYASSHNEPSRYDFTSSYNLLVEQSANFIKKNAALITCIPIALYYHKNIGQVIYDHPFISSYCFYLFLHYICDCILEYKEQKPLFDCIPIIKKTTLDLVICHGLFNYIHQKNLILHPITDDQTFFNTLTEGMHYSFDQIEIMTLTTYIKLRERLNSLNHVMHIESEEFVALCHPSSIDMQTMLYLTEYDYDLHLMIYNFEKNPEVYLEPLVQFLKNQLRNNFMDIQYRLSHQNVNFFSAS